MPITFGNAALQQRSVADRAAQLAAGVPNSGNWDMVTVNETGPHKGRLLFTVFETVQAGVQRHKVATGMPPQPVRGAQEVARPQVVVVACSVTTSDMLVL
jgi:hypothetical protein